jgi:hypothetical protein
MEMKMDLEKPIVLNSRKHTIVVKALKNAQGVVSFVNYEIGPFLNYQEAERALTAAVSQGAVSAHIRSEPNG